MKVKAVYRDLKDQGKTDFMVRVVMWDVPEEVGPKDMRRMAEAGAPPGFELVNVERVDV